MLCCFSSSGTVVDPPDPVEGVCRLPAVNSVLNPFPATAFNHIPIGTGAQFTAQNDPINVDLRLSAGIGINVNNVHAGDLIQSSPGDPMMQLRQRSNNALTTTIRCPAGWPSWGATNSGDRPCTIYDPVLDEVWQMYHFSRASVGVGLHDGAFRVFLTGKGTGNSPRMSSSASRICHCAVMWWADDWRDNTAGGAPFVEHAMSFILARKSMQQLGKTFRFPAYGMDGIGPNENEGSVPYGAGFAIPMPQFGGPADSVFASLNFRQKRLINTLRRYPAFVVDGTGSAGMKARGFGVWTNTMKIEMQNAYVAAKPHLRMISNLFEGQSAWGGGTPLAPNCAWNSGADRV